MREKKLNFEIENVNYVARPDSRDIIEVNTNISEDCHLNEEEVIRVQKTDRFFDDSQDLKTEKLEKFVKDMLKDKNKLKGYDREQENTYSRKNGDADVENISSEDLNIEKKF